MMTTYLLLLMHPDDIKSPRSLINNNNCIYNIIIVVIHVVHVHVYVYVHEYVLSNQCIYMFTSALSGVAQIDYFSIYRITRGNSRIILGAVKERPYF